MQNNVVSNCQLQPGSWSFLSCGDYRRVWSGGVEGTLRLQALGGHERTQKRCFTTLYCCTGKKGGRQQVSQPVPISAKSGAELRGFIMNPIFFFVARHFLRQLVSIIRNPHNLACLEFLDPWKAWITFVLIISMTRSRAETTLIQDSLKILAETENREVLK